MPYPSEESKFCPSCHSWIVMILREWKDGRRVPATYYCISCRGTGAVSALLDQDPRPPGIDDRELDVVMYSPVCLACAHFIEVSGWTGVCAAFDDAIPYVIWSGENDHRAPYPGDGGVLFKSRFAADQK